MHPTLPRNRFPAIFFSLLLSASTPPPTSPPISASHTSDAEPGPVLARCSWKHCLQTAISPLSTTSTARSPGLRWQRQPFAGCLLSPSASLHSLALLPDPVLSDTFLFASRRTAHSASIPHSTLPLHTTILNKYPIACLLSFPSVLVVSFFANFCRVSIHHRDSSLAFFRSLSL